MLDIQSLGTRAIPLDKPSFGLGREKGGKYVAPGVYFYVIEAEGSDGKKYKKKGDINILKYKNEDNSSSDLENSSL